MVGISIADIYLRFPEIMEEEFEDLTEFLEDNNIRYEGATDIVLDLKSENKELQQENKQLKEQLDYLRNGEYLNQLKFERNMLQDIVDNGELSKEDKEFIDMTHRNTELLEQLKERDEVIEEAIEYVNKHTIDMSVYGDKTDLMFEKANGYELLKILNKYKGGNNE